VLKCKEETNLNDAIHVLSNSLIQEFKDESYIYGNGIIKTYIRNNLKEIVESAITSHEELEASKKFKSAKRF
jgi:hypothetical protein